MGAEDWDDPHGITTPEFRERYGDSDTLRDALRRAEARPSTTPESEQKRCAWCGSTQVSAKRAKSNHSQRHAGDFRCKRHGCRRHFSEPADDTTILMNDERADAFEWVEPRDTIDADERGETPLFTTLDERTRTALAIALCQPWHDPGASYRDAAAFFPHSHYWIGRRVRAWKDGEYRELVPDPTAEPEPEPSNDPPIDPRAAVARIGGDYEELVAERAASSDASSGATAVATDGGQRRRWDAYGS